MVVAVHQPHYLPWLGYFDKMDRADVFVVLDTVQFEKNGWQNRNKIKTARGWQWLTVPVVHRFGQRLDEVSIAHQPEWRKKHWTALRTNYGKAPYFGSHSSFFADVYQRQWERLVDLNLYLISYLTEALGIQAKIEQASTMNLSEQPSQRLVDICQALGAEAYMAGIGGKRYMDLSRFEQVGVRVGFQAFEHPVYRQLFGGFEPNMAVVDLLFNHGPASLEIIRTGRKELP